MKFAAAAADAAAADVAGEGGDDEECDQGSPLLKPRPPRSSLLWSLSKTWTRVVQT